MAIKRQKAPHSISYTNGYEVYRKVAQETPSKKVYVNAAEFF